MSTTLHWPVPRWEQLPENVRQDLGKPGYGLAWFEGAGKEDDLRLTLLLLYVKLSHLGLWKFVAYNYRVSVGALEFFVASVEGLKKELAGRPVELSAPGEDPKSWHSREARAKGSLHLKHEEEWFAGAGGRASEVIQAHIDQNGLSCARGEGGWFCSVGAAFKHGLFDATGLEDYTDVRQLREIFVEQGFDPVLLGKPTPNAAAPQPSAR